MTILFSELGIPEHARPLARLIHDFDPRLSLEKLPVGHPWLTDNAERPYAVIHRPWDKPEYVFASYPEHLLDERVFADIIAGFAGTHHWDLNTFDPVAAAAHLLEGRRRQDEIDAANDRMRFALDKREERGKTWLS